MTLTPDLDLGLLGDVDTDELLELACAADLATFAEHKLGYTMAPFHYEWCDLAQTERRLAVVAPREHAKTATFFENATTWRSVYTPGLWTYGFSQTLDQAKGLLARVRTAIEAVAPELVDGAEVDRADDLVLANGARITVAGAGKRVRSAHPDVIIGDDVLDDEGTATEHQRRKTARWWFGTVANMAHPGTTRPARMWGTTAMVTMPATVIHLVGTPFHASDLLMSMRDNSRYHFRRYSAECAPAERVGGTWAVEIA
ncbi:hypothetical protein [Actinomycetospora termitidis]|uniref:Uncharacterized protein n=1 Tax=Actinomycetospora termitidis TaxID=3053470 RepID=A0ABT7MHL9_9PSEU|nr:hypothetical protein [Actinomycetospora sp. Odt1-22]MDL5159432.1 hypothetical protein [Actinomycetospora sp. Odt1-22]